MELTLSTHADEHLMDLGQTLLALVALELTPEFKVLLNHLQCLSVVSGQLNFLPCLIRQVGSLDSLQV